MSEELEASSQPPVDSSQQRTQTNTASTGGGAESVAPQAAVSSLMPDNPPAYSAVDKEHEVQPYQPTQPVTYMPAVQYPTVPFVQYVVAATPVRPVLPKTNFPGPHDFLLFVVITMIVCAILNVTSLVFGIPALVMALMGRNIRISKRDYSKASHYSTIAISLAITTIFYTLLVLFVIVVLPIIFRGGVSLTCSTLQHSKYAGRHGEYAFDCY